MTFHDRAEAPRYRWDEFGRRLAVILGIVFAGGFGLFVVWGGYQNADSAGWISHHEDSLITAQDNWFVGESKDCTSYPHKPEGDATLRVHCDSGPEHHVNVTFYGRVEQPEYHWATWRCTRNAESFTCKQTGAGKGPSDDEILKMLDEPPDGKKPIVVTPDDMK